MDKYTKITPNASKLMESLRSTGYNNYSAICDLIDNSIDANANSVRVEIGTDKDKQTMISITDNGEGMSLDTLKESMRLGSITERNSESDLGFYGMGLITASISIGRRLTVITQHNGEFSTAILDLDEIEKRNDFISIIRKSSDSEKNVFLRYLGKLNSGTIVLVQKVDNLKNTSNLSQFRATLTAKVGEIFREFLNTGREIYIEDKKVYPKDPLMSDHSDTRIVVEDEYEIEINGKKHGIELKVAILPSLSDIESDERKINMANQGFYIMRNNRQIASAETLGIYTRHNNKNRFRAEISFTGSIDEYMGINFTKDGIDHLRDDLRGWIDRKTQPHLQELEKKSQEKRAEKVKDTVDHGPSQRRIRSRANVLTPSFIGVSDDQKAWRDTHASQVEFKVVSENRLGHFIDIGVDGKKLVITYNSGHPFYQEIFQETEDNKNLVNTIDFLSYSVAEALLGITSNQDGDKLRNAFLTSLAINLRTLID